MVPTAGTVVMEMKTPTSAEDFDVVSESTPATPASRAMTNDQASGEMMNSVSGPVVACTKVKMPSAYNTAQTAQAMSAHRANPPRSVVAASPATFGLRRTIA